MKEINEDEKLDLLRKVNNAFVILFEPLLREGCSLDQLRGIVAEHLFSNTLRENLGVLLKPARDPEKWAYDFSLSHVENIRNYRRIYKCSTVDAKRECDFIANKGFL